MTMTATTMPVTDLTELPAPPVDPQLVGIRGWLIGPAIGFVLGPIIGALMLVGDLGLYSDAAAAGYGGLYALGLLVGVGQLAFSIYAATRFFGKKRNAPSTMIALLLTNVAAAGVLLLIALGVGAEDFTESGTHLGKTAITAAIWIRYFRVSKRVRATFVN
jgi:Protein of unknown function (DUF2569)